MTTVLIKRTPIVIRTPIIARVPITVTANAVKRTPIVTKHVKRTPIISRTPIIVTMSYEELHNQLVYYAKDAAGKLSKEVKGTNLLAEFDDLFAEGQSTIWYCWNLYHHKSKGAIYALTKTSIWRNLRHTAYRKYALTTYIDDSVVELADTRDCFEEYQSTSEQVAEIQALVKSDITKKIIKEYLAPSKEVHAEALARVAYLQSLREQGQRVKIPKEIRPDRRSISRVLHLTQRQYREAMHELADALLVRGENPKRVCKLFQINYESWKRDYALRMAA